MRTRLLSALARNRADTAPAPRVRPAASRDVAGLREEIIEHGLTAARAAALAQALEGEGRLLEALEMLAESNRLHRDVAVERRLVRLGAPPLPASTARCRRPSGRLSFRTTRLVRTAGRPK